jgi:hypothetical protein
LRTKTADPTQQASNEQNLKNYFFHALPLPYGSITFLACYVYSTGSDRHKNLRKNQKVRVSIKNISKQNEESAFTFWESHLSTSYLNSLSPKEVEENNLLVKSNAENNPVKAWG